MMKELLLGFLLYTSMKGMQTGDMRNGSKILSAKNYSTTTDFDYRKPAPPVPFTTTFYGDPYQDTNKQSKATPIGPVSQEKSCLNDYNIKMNQINRNTINCLCVDMRDRSECTGLVCPISQAQEARHSPAPNCMCPVEGTKCPKNYCQCPAETSDCMHFAEKESLDVLDCMHPDCDCTKLQVNIRSPLFSDRFAIFMDCFKNFFDEIQIERDLKKISGGTRTNSGNRTRF